MYFLYLFFVPAADKDERQKLPAKTIGLLIEAIQIQYRFLPENYDESVLKNLYNNAILNVLKELILGEQQERFLKIATPPLETFIKDISDPNEPKIPAFIELQFEVLNWAEKYHLGKDGC